MPIDRPTVISSTESNIRSADLVVPDASARLMTVIVGVVVALTFLFGPRGQARLASGSGRAGAAASGTAHLHLAQQRQDCWLGPERGGVCRLQASRWLKVLAGP
jgi:hypothetical protein